MCTGRHQDMRDAKAYSCSDGAIHVTKVSYLSKASATPVTENIGGASAADTENPL